MHSNLATLKTPITAVSSSRMNSINWAKKSKRILANLAVSEIFLKVPYPYVTCDKKHDGDVWPTVLELWPNFVKNELRSAKNCWSMLPVLVWRNLGRFRVTWAWSAWSDWVLHDLWWFCAYWVLHDLWWFCAFWTSTRNRRVCTTHSSRVMPKFRAKMESRATKNAVTSILRADSNSATSKTRITAVYSNRTNSISRPKKWSCWSFWQIWRLPKFSQKCLILL